MEKTMPELMAAISPEDWAQVPESVLKLIHELVNRMDRLEREMGEVRTENELLKEQIARTSANSSQPPQRIRKDLSRIEKSPPERNGVDK